MAVATSHIEHTQKDDRLGLAGVMPRKINVTMIGAGSFFTTSILKDVILIPGSQGGELRLIDIDPHRLELSEKLMRKTVEAAGEGLDTERHSASLSRGTPGVLHGSLSYLLQDASGQVHPAHSISAGLDYPGVGPEHAYLKDSGRATYVIRRVGWSTPTSGACSKCRWARSTSWQNSCRRIRPRRCR